ncbi:MAG: imidazolonepropionase [Verrucomicrobiota bacterium]|nr:imidazolonepropionase [Chthoniobacterales bacterium]MDQ3415308.1 imidazolonepropionase [Verrucomicrobiota bacterium]
MKPRAILHASQLVTLAGPKRPRVGAELSALGIIEDGGMLVRDGVIVATGSSDQIARDLPNDIEVIEAHGRVVLPGFVDAHAHPVFGGTRVDEFEMRARGATYEEIAASGGGIRSTVRKTRAASEAELLAQAQKRVQWFLRSGTTTMEAKSGYGLSLEEELKILRVIRQLNETSALEFVPTFLGAHAIPEEFADAPEQYVTLVIDEMLPTVAEQGLAEYCDIFCERGYFDLADSEKILKAAQSHGLRLRMHVDQLTNSGGAFLAARIGAATADHLEQTNEAEIAALAEAGVQPVLLPASVYALGKTRYPKARAMIDAGLAVVLGTDFNPGSSPTPSIPMVLSLACTQMKMTPAEGITASTINAAYSLNRGERIGSLEAGKAGNFTVFDCADYREIAYWFGTPLVHSVYVEGECVCSAR